MRIALLSLTFLLAGSMAAPAFAHTVAPKKKVTATTKKGKILPMKEYIDQLMAKMTLQEKIEFSISKGSIKSRLCRKSPSRTAVWAFRCS